MCGQGRRGGQVCFQPPLHPRAVSSLGDIGRVWRHSCLSQPVGWCLGCRLGGGRGCCIYTPSALGSPTTQGSPDPRNGSATLRNPPLMAPRGDGLQRNELPEDQETVLLRPAQAPLSQSSTGSKVRLHCSARVLIPEWGPLPTLTLYSPHALSHEASVLRHTRSLRY